MGTVEQAGKTQPTCLVSVPSSCRSLGRKKSLLHNGEHVCGGGRETSDGGREAKEDTDRNRGLLNSAGLLHDGGGLRHAGAVQHLPRLCHAKIHRDRYLPSGHWNLHYGCFRNRGLCCSYATLLPDDSLSGSDGSCGSFGNPGICDLLCP